MGWWSIISSSILARDGLAGFGEHLNLSVFHSEFAWLTTLVGSPYKTAARNRPTVRQSKGRESSGIRISLAPPTEMD